jgi:hypothetical protein
MEYIEGRLFGYIHPYPDGNGRMARFLMNVMLASGGYPWTVIRVEDRNAYLTALDRASIDVDISPFSSLQQCVNLMVGFGTHERQLQAPAIGSSESPDGRDHAKIYAWRIPNGEHTIFRGVRLLCSFDRAFGVEQSLDCFFDKIPAGLRDLHVPIAAIKERNP